MVWQGESDQRGQGSRVGMVMSFGVAWSCSGQDCQRQGLAEGGIGVERVHGCRGGQGGLGPSQKSSMGINLDSAHKVFV